MAYRELLIGCGNDHQKKMRAVGNEDWRGLTTLDFNPDCHPDIEADLEKLPYSWAADEEYDEIHAYEVLEHTGKQGDFRFFFAQFMEFWRILKPDGHLIGSTPHLESKWLWTDPGHTRVIDARNFVFLNQNEYNRQVGVTALTDYRRWFRGDFEVLPGDMFDPSMPPGTVAFFQHDESFWFALRAVKPSRISS